MVWAYSVALVLQLVGTAVTIIEVWQSVQRWRDQYGPGRTRTGYARGVLSFEGSARGRAPVVPLPADATMEQVVARVELLEASLSEQIEKVHKRVDEERENSKEYARGVADSATGMLHQQVSEVVGYLVAQGHRHWWLPWWIGPGILLLGTIVGGVADVIGAR